VDLYPAEQREEIDALNTWMYETINNGVYKCGSATSQAACTSDPTPAPPRRASK
jgi:putative glutathione S-transferase